MASTTVTVDERPTSWAITRRNGCARCVLFAGSVQELAPLAPNNVNTMVCAAVAARLPLDQAPGCDSASEVKAQDNIETSNNAREEPKDYLTRTKRPLELS